MAIIQSKARAARWAGAFTLMELMLSLAVMVFIAGAVLGISFAVTEGWNATGTAQAAQARSTQSGSLLYRTIESMKYAGLATADGTRVPSGSTVAAVSASSGAALMGWRADANDDRMMQASEIIVIEHDLSEKRLVQYTLPATAANAGAQFYLQDISDSDDVAAFKSLPNIERLVLSSGLSEAEFKAYCTSDPAQRQTVEFTLRFEGGRVEYGTASLRGPLVPKDL